MSFTGTQTCVVYSSLPPTEEPKTKEKNTSKRWKKSKRTFHFWRLSVRLRLPRKTNRQRQQNGNPPCFEYYTCMRLILWVNTRHISINSIIRILSITVCVPIICHSWLNHHYNKIWINHHFFAPKVHFLRLFGAKIQ